MSTQLENRPIIQKGKPYKRQPRDTSAFMFPKVDVYRNPALLRLARGQNCTLMLHHGGGHDPATVVSAHSNSAIHHKAKSQKASDAYICWACVNCHTVLDQGHNMTRAEKERAFANAMRETRHQMFVKGLIVTEPGVDYGKAISSDEYWLACWRNGEIRVA
jgi:hypothetical protein